MAKQAHDPSVIKRKKSTPRKEVIVDKENTSKNKGGKFGSWCRTEGHSPNCSCTYN